MAVLYITLSSLLTCISRTWSARRQRLRDEAMAAQAAENATAAAHAAAAVAAPVQMGVGSYTLTEPLLIPGSCDHV